MNRFSGRAVRLSRRWLTPWAWLCWLALANTSLAEPGVTLPQSVPGSDLGQAMRHYEDTEHTLTLADIMANRAYTGWSRVEAAVPHPGFTNSSHWYTLQLSHTGNTAGHYWLEIAHALIDELDIFVVDERSGETLGAWQTGVARLFGSRAVPSHDFIFPLTLQPGQEARVLLRAQSATRLAVPLKLYPEEALVSSRATSHLVFGGYLGVLLVMGLYNLFIYLSLRESNYLYFTMFTLGLGLYFATYTGYAYRYLWPDQSLLNQYALLLTVALALVGHSLFTIKFLNLGQQAPRLARWQKVLAWANGIAGICVFVAPYYWVNQWFVGAALVCSMSTFFTVVYLAPKSQAARSYLKAWCVILFGTTIWVLNRYGFVPYNDLTEYSTVFGAIVSVVMLSFAQADRIHEEKHAKIRAQNEAIKSLKKFQALYENSVEGIFMSDVSGNILRANPALMAMFQWNTQTRGTQAQISATGFYKDAQARQTLLETLARDGVVRDAEVEMVRADGSHMWVSMNMRKTWDEDGKPFIEGSIIDITDRKTSERKLRYLARHDPLTDLYNRREFENRLEQALHQAKTQGSRHSMLYMDLDQFKVVNDTCGHTAGDKLLVQLTQMLLEVVTGKGILARLGGDEFGVLVLNCEHAGAYQLAEDFRQTIQNFRFVWEQKAFSLGVSIGMVSINQLSESVESILSLADTACYIAKDEGRNRIHVYSADDADLQRRRNEMQWVSRLTSALQHDKFELVYQMIAPNKQSEDGLHYEVLLRLRDDDGELIGPGAFLPAAERYNLMTNIDKWVIEHYFKWLHQHPLHLQQLQLGSINLDGQSLGEESLADFILECFKRYRVPYDKICFEVTETSAILNLKQTLKFINLFRRLGCRFSLDDFGSGFSSFSYLKNLPVDYLKIDGVFIKNLMTDKVDYMFVRSITDVAQAMGMKTVAEFVETKAIQAKLKEIGVDYAQGYGVARPAPLSEFDHRTLQELIKN